MKTAASPTSTDSARIQHMFGEVASRYDLLNHLLSASLDRLWRRRAARALGGDGAHPVLDICCGTGDQALALARRDHRVMAADFCLPMLALARSKYASSARPRPLGLAADALVLPFAAESFSGVTVSFGLRNVADLDAALGEIHRVVRSNGELVVLEFAMPSQPLLGALYRVYFERLLPWIGRRISSSDSAYSYLPTSVASFPQRDRFLDHLRRAGFDEGSWRNLSGGIVCLYCARKS